MTAADEVAAAIETVAQFIAANLVRNEAEWGDFPEIGEDDWERVCRRLDDIAPEPSSDAYQAAYDLLAARAEGQES